MNKRPLISHPSSFEIQISIRDAAIVPYTIIWKQPKTTLPVCLIKYSEYFVLCQKTKLIHISLTVQTERSKICSNLSIQMNLFGPKTEYRGDPNKE